MQFLQNIQRGVVDYIKYLGGVSGLIVYSFPAYFRRKEAHGLIQKIIGTQIYYTGNKALNLVSQVALAIGAVTVLQLFTQLSKFGALDYVGRILNIVIIRELGPLATAFIVISRSGSAIAADIGTMKATDQVDALEMMGVDPLRFLVFPRIAAVLVSLTFLTIYFDAIGLFGGFLVGNFMANISPDLYMNVLMNSIGVIDIVSGLVKSVIFSLFIAAIPIYHGFQATTPTEIPIVTTKAVMSSIVIVFSLDVIITILFYI